jgi:hypothetical protein
MNLFQAFDKRLRSKESAHTSSPGAEVLGNTVAEVLNTAADTLEQSCLYFTRENLLILGTSPDISQLIERLDPLTRSALIDGKVRMEHSEQFRAVTDCASDLRVGAESARLAAQLFGLLRDSKTPNAGMTPIRKVTDSAVRALRISARAVSSNDPTIAHDARKAKDETEAIGKELTRLIPFLASYRSPTLCRMIQAAIYSVLITAQVLTDVATGLVIGEANIKPLPPLEKL